MSFRVTSGMLSRDSLQGLQANLSRLQRTQEQITSGRRINRPSDSPVDTATAMRLRAEQQQNTQQGKNIDDGLSWLGQADSSLSQASAMLNRVRQLTVSGLNATNGATGRDAMAAEIDELRSSLIGVANTDYLGRPIFAGTQNVGQAFDAQTGQYQGNEVAVTRNVSSDDGGVPVSLTGKQAFGTLFSDPADPSSAGVLARISESLRSGDMDKLNADLGNLDAAAQTMREAQSLVGARMNRLTGIQTRSTTQQDSLTAALSATENIDLPSTIMDLQVQQTAYQAALGVTAKIIQPSLVDFLR